MTAPIRHIWGKVRPTPIRCQAVHYAGGCVYNSDDPHRPMFPEGFPGIPVLSGRVKQPVTTSSSPAGRSGPRRVVIRSSVVGGGRLSPRIPSPASPALLAL